MAQRRHTSPVCTMYFPTGKLSLVQIQNTYATDTYTPADPNRGHWWNDGVAQSFIDPDSTGRVKRDDLKPAICVRAEAVNKSGRARLSGVITPPTESSSVTTNQGPGTEVWADVAQERTIVAQGVLRRNLSSFLNR